MNNLVEGSSDHVHHHPHHHHDHLQAAAAAAAAVASCSTSTNPTGTSSVGIAGTDASQYYPSGKGTITLCYNECYDTFTNTNMTTNNSNINNNFNQILSTPTTTVVATNSSSVGGASRRRSSIEFLEEFSTFASSVGLDSGRANVEERVFMQQPHPRGLEESRKRKELEGSSHHQQQQDVINNNNKQIEARAHKRLADLSMRTYGNRNVINRVHPAAPTPARVIDEPMASLSTPTANQQQKTLVFFPPLTSTAGATMTTAHGGPSMSKQKVYIVSADEKTYALLLAGNASNTSMATPTIMPTVATTTTSVPISSAPSAMLNTQVTELTNEALKKAGNFARPIVRYVSADARLKPATYMPLQGNCHLMPVGGNRVIAKGDRIVSQVRHAQPAAAPPQQWPNFIKPEPMSAPIQMPARMQTSSMPSMNIFNATNQIGAGRDYSLNNSSNNNNEGFFQPYQQQPPATANHLGGHDVGWHSQQHPPKQYAYGQSFLSSQEQQPQQTYWHQAAAASAPLSAVPSHTQAHSQHLVPTCVQVLSSQPQGTSTNVVAGITTPKIHWLTTPQLRSSAPPNSTHSASGMTSPSLLKKLIPAGPSTSAPANDKSQAKRTMSSATRRLVQHIHLSFFSNLLPNLRKCSKAEQVSTYMEAVSTPESIKSNWMLKRFCAHRQAVHIFARDIRIGLLPEEKNPKDVEMMMFPDEQQDMESNWLEVLVLRSAYYSMWNYTQQVEKSKPGQATQQATSCGNNNRNSSTSTSNNDQEVEMARRRRQLQQLSIEPSLEDFWLLPNELLALRNPESGLNLQRREALLDLVGTLRHFDVSEMEVALLAAWLLCHYDSAPADTEARKEAKARTIAAKSQLFSTMAEYNDVYYPDGKKRTRLLLTSITSAVGFAGGMLADF